MDAGPWERSADQTTQLLAVAVAVGWPTPAQAHIELVSSSPTPGGHVPVGSDRVTLQFTEDLLSVGNAVAVRDPDGRQVTVSAVEARGDVVTARMALTTPGPHTLAYRVIGDDGHPVVGELSFTVEADAAEAATDDERELAAPTPIAAPGPARTTAGSGRGTAVAVWALPACPLRSC